MADHFTVIVAEASEIAVTEVGAGGTEEYRYINASLPLIKLSKDVSALEAFLLTFICVAQRKKLRIN